MVVSVSGYFLSDDGPSILGLVRCGRLHVGLDERQKRPMTIRQKYGGPLFERSGRMNGCLSAKTHS